MIVICIEGCHGCGKTALCQAFEEAGFTTLDEAFMDMPNVSLKPQSLTMELTWLSNWFQRLIVKEEQLKKSGKQCEQIFIADRSPFSAEFYADHGALLGPVVREMIQEVRTQAHVSIYTIYLRVEKDLLWDRIQQRLRLEPFRKKYKEDRREWMETTFNFYDSHEWDFTVPNNSCPIFQTLSSTIVELSESVENFRESSPPRPPRPSVDSSTMVQAAS